VIPNEQPSQIIPFIVVKINYSSSEENSTPESAEKSRIDEIEAFSQIGTLFS